jgi:plastocyanin
MTMSRRTFARLLGGLGLAGASYAMAQRKGSAKGNTVDVAMPDGTHTVFAPAEVQIAVGDTVRWTNKGILVHTVTFDPKQAITATEVVLPAGVAPFASEDLNQDDTYRHTFTAKGTYKYVCKYHEAMGMMGTVVVS